MEIISIGLIMVLNKYWFEIKFMSIEKVYNKNTGQQK
jgi:hypothetical protein